jgi:hypothetical protein
MRLLWTAVGVMAMVGCNGSANPSETAVQVRAVPATTELESIPAPARSTEVLRLAEAAAEAERWRESSDLFSAVWDYEFPVDAFFDSLERSRAEAMAEAARDDELKQLVYLEALRERVRTLAGCPEPFPADLPGEYMVHHLIHLGEEVDPEEELNALDPWRVAIQLWRIRRGDSSMDAGRAADLAVARYLERPDLWTGATTDQLWLLAAETDLVNASTVWPEMIRPQWRHAPSGSGLLSVEVRQWGGGLLDPLPGMTGLLVDGQPVSPAWSGRPEPRELAPGTHVIRFLENHLHSHELPVEIAPGSCSALVLVAIAGV